LAELAELGLVVSEAQADNTNAVAAQTAIMRIMLALLASDGRLEGMIMADLGEIK
jgi:hypothetical protein